MGRLNLIKCYRFFECHMKILRIAILIIFGFIACVISLPHANAQYFGKNKVNYKNFEWYYFSTEHFRILYYEGGLDIARIAARILEDSYEKISEAWNFTLKKPVPIILHKGHNDFEQTNVILEPISAGTGGFTELFKNRIVVPYEGSLSKFRHVLHHELTHAMMFSMLYSGTVESVIGREFMFQVPLWFAEGLAEHESQYWGTEADMFIRDAMVYEYLPRMLNSSIGIYKGGEALMKYIEETWDRPDKKAIASILQSLKRAKNLEESLKSVTGEGIEGILKGWIKDMRIQHWPEVAGREDPEDFSIKLTDHIESHSFINSNPSFSPQGDKIAFLSDSEGYNCIFLMYAVDGRIERKLIQGEQSGDYEEMHWQRGSISFSPDGKSIAFSTKAGPKDVIHLKPIKAGGMNKVIRLDFDGVFSPQFSPDGKEIVFSALEDGYSDLYIIDIETGELTRLTQDFFDCMDPKWSPCGNFIIFASDRADGKPVNWSRINESYDIFIIDKEGISIQRITDNPYDDRDPDWSPDGKHIAFASDRNGIYNIFIANLDSIGQEYPITNVLTNASEPCWSPDPNNSKLAFTSFQNGGWDIFVVKRPLKRRDEIGALNNTVYRKTTVTEDSLYALKPDSLKYLAEKTGMDMLINPTPIRYTPEFSTDYFAGNAQYNSFIGIGGMGILSMSDFLGNHRFIAGMNLYYSIEDSDFDFMYFYLKRRIDIGVRMFHYKTYYRGSYRNEIFADRTLGGSIMFSRPFSKYSRLGLDLSYLNENRERLSWTSNEKYPSAKVFTTSLSLVNDTILWGFTGPMNGRRANFTIDYTPEVAFGNLAYTTYIFDTRFYHNVSKKYVFIFRLTGGVSTGRDPRYFFLGGTDNWINSQIGILPGEMETGKDLYQARFITPLRGYKYFDSKPGEYELWGNKFALMNLEFRYPFIEYVRLGWPIPVNLSNIGGVVFFDAGSVWKDSFRGVERRETGMLRLKDIKTSFGTGIRVYLASFGALLKWDIAWKTDLYTIEKPVHLISLGAEF